MGENLEFSLGQGYQRNGLQARSSPQTHIIQPRLYDSHTRLNALQTGPTCRAWDMWYPCRASPRLPLYMPDPKPAACALAGLGCKPHEGPTLANLRCKLHVTSAPAECCVQCRPLSGYCTWHGPEPARAGAESSMYWLWGKVHGPPHVRCSACYGWCRTEQLMVSAPAGPEPVLHTAPTPNQLKQGGMCLRLARTGTTGAGTSI